jgi:hypothetical protein
VPDGWDLSGGLTAISADKHTLGGWGFGPLGTQSYIIHIDRADPIFANGFPGTPGICRKRLSEVFDRWRALPIRIDDARRFPSIHHENQECALH